MGKWNVSVWVAAAIMLFAAAAAAGNVHIYKWVDGQGVVHYSDTAPPATQSLVTSMTLAEFPPPDPQAEAADQAWIAGIHQWYQSVLDQQAQLQYQEYLAWEQSQSAPAPASAPGTQEPAYLVPVCWQCARFHFRHHHRRPLLSMPTPQSFQNSLWHPRTGPFRLQPFRP